MKGNRIIRTKDEKKGNSKLKEVIRVANIQGVFRQIKRKRRAGEFRKSERKNIEKEKEK